MGLLVAGCGARSEGLLGETSAPGVVTSGPVAPAAPEAGLGLTALQPPTSVFPGEFSFARVIARGDGIDVLANRDGPPFAVVARRARVQDASPFLLWQGDAAELMPGVVSGTVAAANGDALAVCHNQFSGDATSFSSFTGAYQKKSGPALLANNASCNGVAFRQGQGMAAIHALPPGGNCCSRAVVFDINGAGAALSEPELALEEGELGDVRLTAYAGGFAWAGLLNGTEPGLRVVFRKGTQRLTHVLPLTDHSDVAPQIAPWPSGDGVALTVPRDETSQRLLIIEETGAVRLDTALVPPAGERIFRAPVASSPRGLLTAYARCPVDFAKKSGSLVIELRGPPSDPSFTAPHTVTFPITCGAGVTSLAVVGNVVFVLLSTEEGLQGALAAISP